MKLNKNNSSKNLDWILNLDLLHLSSNKQGIVKKMLNCQKEVFPRRTSNLVDMRDFKMKTKLTKKILVSKPCRRVPRQLYEKIKSYIDGLITDGSIRKFYSAYPSPMISERKKNGSLRLCLDYRKVNLKMIPDKYPTPRTYDILDSLEFVYHIRYVKGLP